MNKITNQTIEIDAVYLTTRDMVDGDTNIFARKAFEHAVRADVCEALGFHSNAAHHHNEALRYAMTARSINK